MASCEADVFFSFTALPTPSVGTDTLLASALEIFLQSKAERTSVTKGKPQVRFGGSCHKHIPTESIGFDVWFWSSGERCSFDLCKSRLSCVGERMVILGKQIGSLTQGCCKRVSELHSCIKGLPSTCLYPLLPV